MIRPFSRFSRPIAAALLAATSAIFTILPADAYQVGYNSEGCFAQGDSYQVGSSGTSITAANVIGSSTPCNWTYVVGDYYVSGSWSYGNGPAWVQAGTAMVPAVANATAGVGTHSACNPGGPCPNAVYQPQSQF